MYRITQNWTTFTHKKVPTLESMFASNDIIFYSTTKDICRKARELLNSKDQNIFITNL